MPALVYRQGHKGVAFDQETALALKKSIAICWLRRWILMNTPFEAERGSRSRNKPSGMEALTSAKVRS